MATASKDADRMAAARASKRDLMVLEVRDAKRRAACEADDCEWLRVYCPKVFYNPFTHHQKRIIEDCGESLRYGTKKCKAAPRGDGKSSIVKYLALKYCLARDVRFPLIGAATKEKAKKLLASLQRRLSMRAQTTLSDDYPLETTIARYVAPWPSRGRNVTANGQRPIHVEWDSTHVILPTWEDEEPLGPILLALGITSDELQGCNILDVRPDFVLLDDLDSRDSLASEDGLMAGKIEELVDKTVPGLGGQNRSLGVFMLCTVTSRESAAYKYSDPTQKPSWSGERIAAILKWPDRRDLWDIYIEYRQWGKQTLGDNKQPVDVFGRKAHQHYLDNREAMDSGADLSNPENYERDILPDGSQKQVSGLQRCYDYIADENMDSFLTEHQNDPPAVEGFTQLKLTSYHIQHNCLSGLDRRIVPDGTVAITGGADVRKLGLDYVYVASNDQGATCVVDYDFFEFQTEGRKAADCELLILEGLFSWHAEMQGFPFVTATGDELFPDLTLIDAGWKEESWNAQPVQMFCAQVGLGEFMSSKGMSPYYQPKPSRHIVLGDNWHWDESQCLAFLNADHWKLKVHEGFLADNGEPGSLRVFDPPLIDGRQNRNFHLSFAKHILAETWETRFVPGFKGARTGWWKSPKPNHKLDATYEALAARSMRGISVLQSIGGSNPQLIATPQDRPPIAITPANYSPRTRW